METNDCLQSGLFSDWQTHVSATGTRERSSRVRVRSERKRPRAACRQDIECAFGAHKIRKWREGEHKE